MHRKTAWWRFSACLENQETIDLRCRASVVHLVPVSPMLPLRSPIRFLHLQLSSGARYRTVRCRDLVRLQECPPHAYGPSLLERQPRPSPSCDVDRAPRPTLKWDSSVWSPPPTDSGLWACWIALIDARTPPIARIHRRWSPSPAEEADSENDPSLTFWAGQEGKEKSWGRARQRNRKKWVIKKFNFWIWEGIEDEFIPRKIVHWAGAGTSR